jgi:hypothetical protein
MSRARDLSKLSSPSNFTVDANNNIGVNSTSPDAKLDVIGIVSATSFFGDGSGLTNVGVNSVSFATTSFGLSGTPDIAVRNITGVAATFTGVLTYEDVTNVDSVGIVTARTGIKVLAGGIDAVGVVTATSFKGDGSQLSGVGGENDITSSLFI